MAASSAEYDARLRQALLLYRAGRISEALAAFAALAAEYEDDSRLLIVCATASLKHGERARGLSLLARALELEPDNALAHYQLGVALDEQQRVREALDHYEQAIRAMPNFAEAHNNRGVALKALGRVEQALASFERAIALNPDYGKAHANLGNALGQLKRSSEALRAYDRAIHLDPGHAEAHCNRGVVLRELGRLNESLASIDRAIALKPDRADSHGHRGESLHDLGRLDEASASFERAVELQPEGGLWLGWLFDAKRAVCDWQDLDGIASKLLAAIDSGQRAIDPFSALLLSGAPQLHRRVAERWAAELAVEPHGPGQMPALQRGGRIRLGYFSADFHYHATLHLVMDMFEAHDRSRFELFGFSFGQTTDDDWGRRARRCFDRFFDVRSQSDGEIAELARSLNLDVAVDLKGFTTGSRAGIFARRCAPIQISYLGYPGTMGAPFIDYLIADHTVIPPASRQYYTERIAYLPGCYQPNRRNSSVTIDEVPTRSACGLPDDRFVFCCFSNSNRITPSMFDCWMRILQRVETSVLWLLESNRWVRANLQAEAARRGVDPGRLLFSPFRPVEEQLGRLRHAQLFLDTLPYNAHTTASDALRVGVPLLTQIGEAFAGRVAASLLSSLGLQELITGSPQEYEELAVALARDPERLGAIRQRLAAAVAEGPLFNPSEICRHIEQLYETMCARHTAGLAPDYIGT
jgi:predicted O-linked N-acetylglucosamine transferase (SPINDLY family)